MWTHFMDMASGGGHKTQYDYIFIEDSMEHAIDIFIYKFDRDPNMTTCECCGEDYYITEYETFNQAASFLYTHNSQKELRERDDILIITKEEAKNDAIYY